MAPLSLFNYRCSGTANFHSILVCITYNKLTQRQLLDTPVSISEIVSTVFENTKRTSVWR